MPYYVANCAKKNYYMLCVLSTLRALSLPGHGSAHPNNLDQLAHSVGPTGPAHPSGPKGPPERASGRC
jgi:hypothetical protein